MKKSVPSHVDEIRTATVTELPLFPLNVVLFPGMMLPLHIFEPRYQEMIGHCLEKNRPFGVVLIRKGQQVGAPALPHRIGTTARIRRVKRLEGGRMDIHTVGVQRFRVRELNYDKPYLTASVEQMPVLNGATRLAGTLANKVRPKLAAYIDLLARAHAADPDIGYIPHDAKTLAFLIAASLQMNTDKKQALLELPGVPEMLSQEYRLLSEEMQLIEHMLATQESIASMGGGASGYLFPN